MTFIHIHILNNTQTLLSIGLSIVCMIDLVICLFNCTNQVVKLLSPCYDRGLTFYSDSRSIRYFFQLIFSDARVVADVDLSGVANVEMGTPFFIFHFYVSSLVIIPTIFRRWVAF